MNRGNELNPLLVRILWNRFTLSALLVVIWFQVTINPPEHSFTREYFTDGRIPLEAMRSDPHELFVGWERTAILVRESVHPWTDEFHRSYDERMERSSDGICWSPAWSRPKGKRRVQSPLEINGYKWKDKGAKTFWEEMWRFLRTTLYLQMNEGVFVISVLCPNETMFNQRIA